MTTNRQFWVRWRGTLVATDFQIDPADPRIRMFLRAIGTEFATDEILGQTAVVAPGDNTIALSAVVQAEDEGSAVNTAKTAFETAIARAGGKAELPDGNHKSWSVKELQDLIRLVQAEVKELQPA
jgi:hypothetical protein